MARSRRRKEPHFTKVEKNPKVRKAALIEKIHEAFEEYSSIWLFRVDNVRNSFVKDIRRQWTSSRIFMGRTKVMAFALGRSKEAERGENLHLLTDKMNGDVGLFFTNNSVEEVREWFDNFIKDEFARSGNEATSTVVIPAGPLYSRAGQISAEEDVPISYTMEPMLRQMGMPTLLQKGVVQLLGDYTICKEGKILDPNQSKLLKLFRIPMAKVKVNFDCCWTKDGQFIEL